MNGDVPHRTPETIHQHEWARFRIGNDVETRCVKPNCHRVLPLAPIDRLKRLIDGDHSPSSSTVHFKRLRPRFAVMCECCGQNVRVHGHFGGFVVCAGCWELAGQQVGEVLRA